jgi:hypothetical protein
LRSDSCEAVVQATCPRNERRCDETGVAFGVTRSTGASSSSSRSRSSEWLEACSSVAAMSKKMTLISVLATAGTAALLGAAAVRGARAARRRAALASPRGRGRRPFPRPLHTEFAELPRHVVLPLAFWDASAELDTEDDLPSPEHALGTGDEAYDSIDDASAIWLARATQSTAPSAADVDDPAEIAADSISMVSEASRLAAGADPSGFLDTPPASEPR